MQAQQCQSDSTRTSDAISALACLQGPGMGAPLLSCAVAARILSQMWKVPLVGVNHCVGHIEMGRTVTGEALQEARVVFIAPPPNTRLSSAFPKRGVAHPGSKPWVELGPQTPNTNGPAVSLPRSWSGKIYSLDQSGPHILGPRLAQLCTRPEGLPSTLLQGEAWLHATNVVQSLCLQSGACLPPWPAAGTQPCFAGSGHC